MSKGDTRYLGGCLCGAVRFEARGEPNLAGHCYCRDCQKASGSGFMPFMGYAASALTLTGETLQFRSASARGTDAVRNSCKVCGSLVFGGIIGVDESHTLYAGALDDPSVFHPKIAIFTRDRPDWAVLPADLIAFETLPGDQASSPQGLPPGDAAPGVMSDHAGAGGGAKIRAEGSEAGMVHRLVSIDLTRADLPKFEAYEQKVLSLLGRHGGRLLLRVRALDESLETHLVAFPSPEAFERYRTDPERLAQQGEWVKTGAQSIVSEVRMMGRSV